MKKILSTSIILLITSLSTIVLCGNIVYPWRSTTAILKSGESFEVWFNASTDQNINSIQIKSKYTSVNTTSNIVKGNWVYDPMSGNSFNTKITVGVPAGTPADRYDLVLNTSLGEVTSFGGVKIVNAFKDEYYVMHISDGHLYQSGYDTDVLLQRKSAMIDIADIIDAQIIIETGDNMYNVINHPEREGYYFLGNSSINTRGMAQAHAATFLVPGDHDGLVANDFAQGTAQQNADFFNDYWGMQCHNFKYGNSRFIDLNNAWAVSETNPNAHQYQINDAISWLHNAGSGGNFIVSSGHCYNKMHSFIDADTHLNLVLAGDKHHIYVSNPYSFTSGSAAVAYVAASIINHFAFNLIKINNITGTFTTPSGTTGSADVLFSGSQDTPSTWVTNLKLTYSALNDGSIGTNTATIENKYAFPITGAKVRFVVPKGYLYSITNGIKEQEFDGTSVHVVDVKLNIDPNSTTKVGITADGIIDLCPDDPNKTNPGLCGCGVPEGTCTIPVTGITMTPAKATLNLNVTKQLSTTIEPFSATNKVITWTTSDEAVATVSPDGLVTAVGGGTATITAITRDGGKIANSTITVIPNYTVYQAEDAEFNGPLIVTNQTGFNGTGFLDFTNSSNDYIKWTVYAPSAGTYTLSFRYSLLSGSRPLKLSVNGVEKISSIAFPITGSWSTWSNYTTNQPLNKGNNTIMLSAIGSNGGNFDELTISDGPTGLNNLNSGIKNKSFRIYPNPFEQGKLTMDIFGFENMNNVQVKITDCVGQIIFQEKIIDKSHLELNLSDKLKKSVYFISVESGTEMVLNKLIVK